MQTKFKTLFSTLFLTAPLLLPHTAQAEGKLTVYCSVQNNVCEDMMKKFSAQYQVETQFIHGGTGTIFGRIKAEKRILRRMFGTAALLSPISKRHSWVY